MSKRRINKQQSARIEKIQARYCQNDSTETQHDGLIIACFGRQAEVEYDDSKRIRCSIRANMSSLTAGDRVVWQPDNAERGVIVSRYPRETELIRNDKRGQTKSVAANINQLIIVMAPKPEPSWLLLDSYLVMAENLQVNAVIVFNKVDMPCDFPVQELKDCYQKLGYPVLFTSREQTPGYKELQNALSGHVSVFIGQSGVGKSTLISAILPHEQGIATAAISENSELGCHTTSNSYFYHLPSGGALIDSPGVREFALSNLPKADILRGFRDLKLFTGDCKFRNCNHKDSLGCALVEAYANGRANKRRYENFIRLSNKEGFPV